LVKATPPDGLIPLHRRKWPTSRSTLAKPYERPNDTEAAMNAYLSWEVDLLERIKQDGTTHSCTRDRRPTERRPRSNGLYRAHEILDEAKVYIASGAAGTAACPSGARNSSSSGSQRRRRRQGRDVVVEAVTGLNT
jgi:hypothetical protein